MRTLSWLDGYRGDSLTAKFRDRRWQTLVSLFPEIREMRVLDLGGTPWFWRHVEPRPRSVLTLNIVEIESDLPWVHSVVGDVCTPPSTISPGHFDLVFSNSLLEHLPAREQRVQFAKTVGILDAPYWIQTPNRYFPVEPHWVFPFAQFMPLPIRASLGMWWPLSYLKVHTWREGFREARNIRLLGRKDLQMLFPDAKIIVESVAGLPKSWVAVGK